MTVVKINAITVPPELGEEVAKRFAARAGAVDDAEGFEGFELFKPEDDRNQWLVVTRWNDEASFEKWRNSGQAAHAHRSTSEEAQKPLGLSAELWHYSVSVVSEGQN
ncbi:MAG: antibiotic biosynthesis monooxygenase [Acidimicrobiales bacterium]|jgi:heme-degrading monooxygenase HmoA|nr:antibiotic biosynthesis monooxygenase [Acidimicrobiales bacterium]MDP6297816.1 antibiotic biosynthesis monooxygenase [Acidimicrobiales bacterium]HJM28973.1 antibiotic biosynthesis monooxygenase [Acidimicrobiales bacterium]HJM97062.1 antibiotic biosynthesis monooxygenase [Acidimicrobiales bacterium]|tara:strand:+ start:210 stop:530 length:321 start_codon:yes stop_codon:yes gene_type:complete